MPVLLYIDTAAATATVALSVDGGIAALQTLEEAHEQAALLNGMIGAVLSAAGKELAALDAICVCAGPGSYTGLRVGLSTAKGLAYALDKPLLLFNRLDLMALPLRGKDNFAIALKARKDEYFCAVYDKEARHIQAPVHVFASGLPELAAAGTLVYTDDPDFSASLPVAQLPALQTVAADLWLPLAESRFAAAQFDDLAYAEPFYLKAAYTTQSKK